MHGDPTLPPRHLLIAPACLPVDMRREMDLAILQEALAREAAEEAAEAAAREAKRQATLQYRKQLAAMMAKQEADQGEEEARVDAINRQQQAKREAEWAARDAARRKLMAEVEQIRQEQIARKQQDRCALLALSCKVLATQLLTSRPELAAVHGRGCARGLPPAASKLSPQASLVPAVRSAFARLFERQTP